jgi:hypothetical protein
MVILRIGQAVTPRDILYRIVAGSQSAICGKIISSTVVITIDSMRMLRSSTAATR